MPLVELSAQAKQSLADAHLVKDIFTHINRIGEGVIQRGIEGAAVESDQGLIKCTLQKIALAITVEQNAALEHMEGFFEQKRDSVEHQYTEEWLESMSTAEGIKKLQAQLKRSQASLHESRVKAEDAKKFMQVTLMLIQQAKIELPNGDLGTLRNFHAEQRMEYVVAKSRVNAQEVEVALDTNALQRAESVKNEREQKKEQEQKEQE